MNKLALWHQAKSEYAYAYDEKTLHILLRTAKNDCSTVTLIHGDPFYWEKNNDGKLEWHHEQQLMVKRYQSDLFDYYFCAIEPPYLRTKYAFLIQDDANTYLFGTKQLKTIDHLDHLYAAYDLSEYYNFPYLNDEDLHHTPTWVKDTIWYQIFPDRFFGIDHISDLTWGKLPVFNHEHYGGNLKGVTAKLDYLKELGVTGIYFTPLFLSPTAHKYDTIDYFNIDPQFGSNDDFKKLVSKAHEHGIKVMLDGVFNHCGFHHPFFQDVIELGEKSLYKDCFYIDKFPVINFPLNGQGKPINYQNTKLNYKTFAFTPNMPKWNTRHPLVEKHLLEVITFWIREFDIDGWRLDVSNEVSHDFLRKIKQVSRTTKKETFILGENWDSSLPWLKGDQMDSVMNYDLSYPIWKYCEHKIDLNAFKDIIQNYLATTPKNVMDNMFNLVGSHDTVRIKRRLNDDARRVKIAYALMFLSAGAPNIYYGDEVGLTGDHDPDNRRCMLWSDDDIDHDFFNFTKSLIELRKTSKASRTSDYHFIDHEILMFTKNYNNEELLVIINNHDKPSSISIPKPYQLSYHDTILKKNIKLHDTINLEAYQLLILQREV